LESHQEENQKGAQKPHAREGRAIACGSGLTQQKGKRKLTWARLGWCRAGKFSSSSCATTPVQGDEEGVRKCEEMWVKVLEIKKKMWGWRVDDVFGYCQQRDVCVTKNLVASKLFALIMLSAESNT